VNKELVSKLEKKADAPEAFTFEAFADVWARCRMLQAEEKRKRSGLPDKDFDMARKLFNKRAKPGTKELEKGELLFLLIDLGIPASTADERDAVFSQLARARRNALDAGVEAEEVGGFGSPTSFWTLLHFLASSQKKNAVMIRAGRRA